MKTLHILTATLLLPSLLLAHGNEVHDDKEKEEIKPKKEVVEEVKRNIYEPINQSYLNNIKPIFENKCFNCHSNKPNYPFYYKIPGVKQLIDHDIKEAKTHIDMSDDFPFISHDSPINDLKSIRKSTINDTMPPLRYVIAHWDSRLDEVEKEQIIKWVDESLKLLKK